MKNLRMLLRSAYRKAIRLLMAVVYSCNAYYAYALAKHGNQNQKQNQNQSHNQKQNQSHSQNHSQSQSQNPAGAAAERIFSSAGRRRKRG